MKEGMEVTIGRKYASHCAYRRVIGFRGVIQSMRVRKDPYGLEGKHTICIVEVDMQEDAPWRHRAWDIHIDDCLPLDNKGAKHLLMRLED